MHERQGTECLSKRIIGIATLLLESVQIATNVYTEHGGLGHVHINVGAQVVLLVVGCIIENQTFVLFQQTSLLKI